MSMSDNEVVQQLRNAAMIFAKRTDGFAVGKAGTCDSIANAVERYGKFASAKQFDYALKLIEWANKPPQGTRSTVTFVNKPPAQVSVDADANPAQYGDTGFKFPGIVGLFSKERIGKKPLTKLVFGDLILNASWSAGRIYVNVKGRSLAIAHLMFGSGMLSLKLNLEGVAVTVNGSRLRKEDLLNLLRQIEADPLETAKEYGKRTGICCVCGAELTNEESVQLGIGPICGGRM